MRTLVLFGAGNIGRSFIGQLFSRAGYEVVFVDIDDRLIQALNHHRRYRVIIKRNDQPDETLWITNVRGVHGTDRERVSKEIADAAVLATAVGKTALPHILPSIAQGLLRRWQQHGERPLDIIMAENFRNAADYAAQKLKQHLPAEYPFELLVGLVETSIGKMVPIMREEDIARDPLWIFAEAYNQLIVDAHGFNNPIPPIPGIAPQQNMKAFVDRKLFIHNLGHAATAYFGYQHDPAFVYIYEPLAIPDLFQNVRQCMLQAARALHAEYPEDLPMAALIEHIDDLLSRFQNRALGDTIFRVGRDLPRKLHKDDRLVGAMLLAKKHGCACDLIAEAVRAACQFRARDEHGRLFPADKEFAEQVYPRGLDYILTHVCQLSRAHRLEAEVMDEIGQTS
ncbi:mannitol-1-phosphate 5-dehydrogenase [candidate division KSB3 bacterium]|uniref:Mannitol-1-phosphate 5-dehydrogenase n=1 Tax=candidate division KSB3 bacterium TaxID=2044937 RepID=A0A9D5Q450_9BACT|nr:mannitol-1-phosphate 5-dehydrogenase [candidate division KSB3 bacterium]MBD3323190.1 mannitol-1-phosphate 5-dehydrogenase [candidate division KSB3 bacterium]